MRLKDHNAKVCMSLVGTCFCEYIWKVNRAFWSGWGGCPTPTNPPLDPSLQMLSTCSTASRSFRAEIAAPRLTSGRHFDGYFHFPTEYRPPEVVDLDNWIYKFQSNLDITPHYITPNSIYRHLLTCPDVLVVDFFYFNSQPRYTANLDISPVSIYRQPRYTANLNIPLTWIYRLSIYHQSQYIANLDIPPTSIYRLPRYTANLDIPLKLAMFGT